MAGRPTLRSPAGRRELESGEVVCFPAGPEGAHYMLRRGGHLDYWDGER